MSGRKFLALGGFLALGLSPSFVDWQQAETTEQKVIIIGYYAAALWLIYFGILKD